MRVEEALDRIQWEALVIFGVESKRSRLIASRLVGWSRKNLIGLSEVIFECILIVYFHEDF
jgi:hypothetical protein